MSNLLKLDESWEAHYQNYHLGDYYLNGASQFQQKAIEELTIELKESSLVGDYNQGIFRGLGRAIKIIKNLKP